MPHYFFRRPRNWQNVFGGSVYSIACCVARKLQSNNYCADREAAAHLETVLQAQKGEASLQLTWESMTLHRLLKLRPNMQSLPPSIASMPI